MHSLPRRTEADTRERGEGVLGAVTEARQTVAAGPGDDAVDHAVAIGVDADERDGRTAERIVHGGAALRIDRRAAGAAGRVEIVERAVAPDGPVLVRPGEAERGAAEQRRVGLEADIAAGDGRHRDHVRIRDGADAGRVRDGHGARLRGKRGRREGDEGTGGSGEEGELLHFVGTPNPKFFFSRGLTA